MKHCRSLSRGNCLYRGILGHSQGHAFHEKKKCQHNSHVALYYAGMNSKDLNYIFHEISKPDRYASLAICTIAFGMSINISDIDLMIHCGACFSIMDYWQKIRQDRTRWEKSKGLVRYYTRNPLAGIQ